MLDEPYPGTVDEIGCEIRDPGYATDAVNRLAAAGLVHRLGEFVFPTRTTHRAAELQVGTNWHSDGRRYRFGRRSAGQAADDVGRARAGDAPASSSRVPDAEGDR